MSSRFGQHTYLLAKDLTTQKKGLRPLFLGYSIFILIFSGTTFNLLPIISHYWHFARVSTYLLSTSVCPYPSLVPTSTSGSQTLMHTAMLMPSVGFLSLKPKKNMTPPEFVLLMDHLKDLPVTTCHIAVLTRWDPVFSKVLNHVERGGWPNDYDKLLSTYGSKRNELSVHQGCLMWGSQVIIPPKGQEAVLQELHKGHPGMTKMFLWAAVRVRGSTLNRALRTIWHVVCQNRTNSIWGGIAHQHQVQVWVNVHQQWGRCE